MNPYVIVAVLLVFCGYTAGVYEFAAHNTRTALRAKQIAVQAKEDKREGAINVDVATHVGDNHATLESEKPDVHQQVEAAFRCPAVPAAAWVRGRAVVPAAGAASQHDAPAAANVAVSEHATGDRPGRSGEGEDAQTLTPLTAATVNENLDAGASNTVSCAGLQEWAARICAEGHCE